VSTWWEILDRGSELVVQVAAGAEHGISRSGVCGYYRLQVGVSSDRQSGCALVGETGKMCCRGGDRWHGNVSEER